MDMSNKTIMPFKPKNKDKELQFNGKFLSADNK